jgi:PST family polysaccharide transporter/lipopolysaccharide exporter
MGRRIPDLLDILRGHLLPGEGLAERAVKGGFWMTATNIFDRALQLVLLVILARLLSPTDFGLMGIALLTLNALRRLSRIGLQDALIYNIADNVDAYLNTAWTVEVVRGIGLASIAYLSAPFVAMFFGEPRALDVIRVIAVSPILNGFRNPAVVYFKKNLDFHKQFAYTMSGSVVNFVVATGVAVVYGSVWALVVGYVAADLVRLVVSYALDQFRPIPEFHRQNFVELFSFGKWITGTDALLFVANEGDDAVVGYVLTAASLGFYQVAYQIAKAPAAEVSSIVSSVTFPVYSKLQDDIDALREVFFKTVQVTTFVSFPISVGIIVTSSVFVRGFLGTQWLPIVPVMQLIGVYSLLISLGSTFGSVWKSLGRPDYVTKLVFARVVLMAALIFPATRQFGIVGAAAVVVGVYAFPMMPIDIHLVVRSVETTYVRFFREITYPLVAATVMGVAVHLVDRAGIVSAPIPEFFLLVLTGGLAYVIAVAVLETQLDWGIKRSFRTVLNAVAG